MEGVVRNRLNFRTIKVAIIGFFITFFTVYLIIGFQPIIPAEAASYPALSIPSIGLTTRVEPLTLQDHELIAPATIAGSYSRFENRLFIIGHSSSVFKHLDSVRVNDQIIYDDATYQVSEITTIEKSKIDMATLLADTPDPTLVIMTCAGAPLPEQDATHRLIIYANRINP